MDVSGTGIKVVNMRTHQKVEKTSGKLNSEIIFKEIKLLTEN